MKNKRIISVVASFVSAMLAGAMFAFPRPLQQGARSMAKYNHVPETAEKLRPILPGARDRAHIAIVNVGEAVPEAMWAPCVVYACSKISINVWTNSMATAACPLPTADSAAVRAVLGPKAIAGVFLVNRADMPRVLQCPGLWCMVNVREALKGERQTVKDRLAKLVLKGIHGAVGAGDWSPEGLDRIIIGMPPAEYFPLLEALDRMGAAEARTPYEESHE